MVATLVQSREQRHSGCAVARPPVHDGHHGIHPVRRAEREQCVTTAFVFSGGGARGALQVGALQALLECGVRPDMVIGTSIGAWNAAWLARSPTLAGVRALADVWRQLHASNLFFGRTLPGWMPLRGLLLLAAVRRIGRGRSSLYDGAGMRKLLADYFGDLSFGDLALPLSIIAANLTDGGRTVFQRGPLAPAVLASSAIPGIFPPVQIGDAVYADGGTVDGCSVETAVAMGARRIIILANGYDLQNDGGGRWIAPRPGDSLSMAAVLQRASQVMGTHQIQQALGRLPRGIEAHVIGLASGDEGGTLNFRRVPAWIEHGYATTHDYLRATASLIASAA